MMPHQDLAQLRVGLNEPEQLLAIELDHFAGLADTHPRHRGTASDHAAFTGKLSRVVPHDQSLRGAGQLHNLELAADDDKTWRLPVAGFDQHFAARGLAAPSVRGDPRHLLRGERWKGVPGTRSRRRQRRRRGIRRHGPTSLEGTV